MKTATMSFILLTLSSLLCAVPLCAQQEVPEAAKGHFTDGVALIEKAEKPADFLAAMAKFEEAAAIAPQWPDIHFNLAKLAAETDKPAKAIKEYRTYLALLPAAVDRAAVEGEIAKLKEYIALKRKIGLPGVKFVAFPDSIGVLQIFPGSRIGKTGLQPGSKIVAINGKTVAGHNLDSFFKEIDTVKWPSEDKMTRASMERMYSRFSGRDMKEEGPVMTLSVITGGSPNKILVKKSMFQSSIIEIEADEFETEVLKESLPVVVTFWNGDCPPCQEFVPVVEAESVKYAGKVKFVNINVDENKKLARELQIKGVPTLMVYKGGAKVSADTGKLPKEKVEAILKNIAQ